MIYLVNIFYFASLVYFFAMNRISRFIFLFELIYKYIILGQSVGSREDFASLSLGECPNLELTEDGPDLTPRAWDVFAAAGNYEADLEGEDVVLG